MAARRESIGASGPARDPSARLMQTLGKDIVMLHPRRPLAAMLAVLACSLPAAGAAQASENRSFDCGGPGIATEVPAKYVYGMMFQAQNLGQGFAASTMMLISVIIIIIPWAYLEFGGKRRG